MKQERKVKMDEIKKAYKKGEKAGFIEGVKAATEVIKTYERDPEDMTRVSLVVNRELDALLRCD